jgi:hypothetical protein
VFKVRVDGREPIEWRVDTFDLDTWFYDVVGRYPRSQGGDQEQEDIQANWPRLEPRLRKEIEREARLPFKIVVDGTRTSPDEWSRAQAIAKAELPPLSEAQRATAKSLGVAEEAYARMIFAAEHTSKKLLAKAEMFGRLIAEKLKALGSQGRVESVALRTLENRFDVGIRVNGSVIPLRIKEDLADDIFESGSADAEERLARILSTTIGILERQ